MKKYCLYNYFDRQKEHITEFVVAYDSQKDREQIDNIFENEDQTKHKDLDFVGRVRTAKTSRIIEDINVKNPDYVLNHLVEDMAQKSPTPDNLNLMKSAHLVSNKIQSLRKRVSVLENENSMLQGTTAAIENQIKLSDNLGSRESMNILNDLISDGNNKFK